MAELWKNGLMGPTGRLFELVVTVGNLQSWKASVQTIENCGQQSWMVYGGGAELLAFLAKSKRCEGFLLGQL